MNSTNILIFVMETQCIFCKIIRDVFSVTEIHSRLPRLISNQRQVTSLHSRAAACKFHQSNKQSCGVSGAEFLPRGNFPNMFASLAMHTAVLFCGVGITTKPAYHVNITGEVTQWLLAVNNYTYIYPQNQQANN